MRCLLCDSEKLNDLQHSQWDVAFFHCGTCDLIFRDPQSFPSWEAQKTRYDQHNNCAADPQYQQYFQQFIRPLAVFLEKEKLRTGLDWGAGPGPTLGPELNKLGFQVQSYDPIYLPLKLMGSFDFVTCTEVIEHFQTPLESWAEVLKFVKAEGIFAGMTNFHQGREKFSSWWYAKDPTHVCFYSENTFSWIEKKWRLKALLLQSPIFIFQKS